MTTRIPAIQVNQWLDDWNKVLWSPTQHRAEPGKSFFVCSMRANDLKRLSRIYRRSLGVERRQEDLAIQRRHDEKRSKKIKSYVKEGYPYNEIPQRLKEGGDHESLRKPGWLPTGIVINLLKAGDERDGKVLAAEDEIKITQDQSNPSFWSISLPDGFSDEWQPRGAWPIEVIDGQHRLWAFEGEQSLDNFELPVIAFHGLDISWQAYIFWSINVSPVTINKSLVFDMYPLLRYEDWVDKLDGHKVYKEARAQELVEAVWVHPESPWRGKINMLAEPGNHYVRQAAWARAIISAFMKNLNLAKKTGGLFGELRNARNQILPWTRAQQAAFLIYFGRCFSDSIYNTRASWALNLRDSIQPELSLGEKVIDPAMFGSKTLLSTDQGVRVIWALVNDICVYNMDSWEVFGWAAQDYEDDIDNIDCLISRELSALAQITLGQKINSLALCLADFDWRTSSAPGLNVKESELKSVYRGSGGYKILKRHCLEHINQSCQEILGGGFPEVMLSESDA